MCRALIGQKEGVEVSVSLGRPILSNVMTVFIPTAILLLISHITKIFDKHYVDMVMEVNLTVLLVLSTL